MGFLFSRSPKDDLLESAEEDSRARIQAAIDRAIQLPAVEMPQDEDIKEEFTILETFNENAA